MQYSSTFSYEQQSKLAGYCRDGKPRPIHGVVDSRISHYRRLVFNVVSDSLSSAFPLTQRLLGQQVWDTWVEDFWSTHKCQSPHLWKMPLEFFEFIRSSDDADIKLQYPCLEELLWFEWLEIYVYMREDQPNPYKIIRDGDVNTHKLVVNPELSLEIFSFPVFKKQAELITHEDKGVYYLSVHRQQDEEGNVIYNELSAPMARLVECCKEQPLLMMDAVARVCQEFSLTMDEQTVQSVQTFVTHGIASGIFLGYTLDRMEG